MRLRLVANTIPVIKTLKGGYTVAFLDSAGHWQRWDAMGFRPVRRVKAARP